MTDQDEDEDETTFYMLGAVLGLLLGPCILNTCCETHAPVRHPCFPDTETDSGRCSVSPKVSQQVSDRETESGLKPRQSLCTAHSLPPALPWPRHRGAL